MSTESNIALVIKYLNNKLSLEEKMAFEERLEDDTALQDELRIQQHILTAQEGYRRKKIRESVAKIVEEDNIDSQKKSHIKRAIIISIILASIALVFFYLYRTSIDSNVPNTNEMIAGTSYAKNIPYELDPNRNHKGTSNSQIEKRLNSGLELMRTKKYQSAIDTFSLLLPSSEAHYYLGHVYFQKGDYDQSIKEWKKAEVDTDLKAQASFFLALSYLSNEDISSFTRIAKEIENGPYGESIRNIQRQLQQ